MRNTFCHSNNRHVRCQGTPCLGSGQEQVQAQVSNLSVRENRMGYISAFIEIINVCSRGTPSPAVAELIQTLRLQWGSNSNYSSAVGDLTQNFVCSRGSNTNPLSAVGNLTQTIRLQSGIQRKPFVLKVQSSSH